MRLRNMGKNLTNEVIRVEEVIVPHLNGQTGRKVQLGLVQTVEVCLTEQQHY